MLDDFDGDKSGGSNDSDGFVSYSNEGVGGGPVDHYPSISQLSQP
ncbi:12094_t:CDS:1, partial [Funneliformis geosporum]